MRIRRHALLTAIALTALLSPAMPALGQGSNGTDTVENPSLTAQATDLLEAGEPQQAYDLLADRIAAHEDDPEYRFLTGMAAMETGRPGVAATNFEAALEQNPDLPRVRLELARAYEQIDRNEKSKRLIRNSRR